MTKLPLAARFALVAIVSLGAGVGLGVALDRKALDHRLNGKQVAQMIASSEVETTRLRQNEAEASQNKWKADLIASGLGEYNSKTGDFQLRSTEDIASEVSISQTFGGDQALATTEAPEAESTSKPDKAPPKPARTNAREANKGVDKPMLVPFTRSNDPAKLPTKTASVR